jgi:hypothetical protein
MANLVKTKVNLFASTVGGKKYLCRKDNKLLSFDTEVPDTASGTASTYVLTETGDVVYPFAIQGSDQSYVWTNT